MDVFKVENDEVQGQGAKLQAISMADLPKELTDATKGRSLETKTVGFSLRKV